MSDATSLPDLGFLIGPDGGFQDDYVPPEVPAFDVEDALGSDGWRTRCPTRHGDLRPRVGAQGVLHIKGGHLRRHVVVLETPVGADQETKVRQRSRVTHRFQG